MVNKIVFFAVLRVERPVAGMERLRNLLLPRRRWTRQGQWIKTNFYGWIFIARWLSDALVCVLLTLYTYVNADWRLLWNYIIHGFFFFKFSDQNEAWQTTKNNLSIYLKVWVYQKIESEFIKVYPTIIQDFIVMKK